MLPMTDSKLRVNQNEMYKQFILYEKNNMLSASIIFK